MRLRIDHLTVETSDPRAAEDTIRRALALLAARLAATSAQPRSVPYVQITPARLTASQLADDLYRELT